MITVKDFVQVLPSKDYTQRQQWKIDWYGYVEQVRGERVQVIFIDRQKLWFKRDELRLAA